jgi:sterol desaturase/sphingolipid hydroxylase (fatty acid hydroxylase superfamily)
VHHIDPDLDVSTSFRFHFGEVLYSLVFRALQVYVLGISLITYLVYELVFQCATMFHHSNVRLPIVVERALNKIMVTPRMHGIHHSIVKGETNSNYAVIFRWWDLLHGTLRLNVKQSDIVIGVPAYLEPQDNQFLNLLILPFRRQRSYWGLSAENQQKRSPLSNGEHILLP